MELEKVKNSEMSEGALPMYSSFPIQELKSLLSWDDLILNSETSEMLNEIKFWLMHRDIVNHDPILQYFTQDKFRAIFHGPSGTGKTLAATLLGQVTDFLVYKIDLDNIMNLLYGSNENTIRDFFKRAEEGEWVLVFDNVESLFVENVNSQDLYTRARERLRCCFLQCMEKFCGPIIIVTNTLEEISSDFISKVQSVIPFKTPGWKEKQVLWQKSFSPYIELDPLIDVKELSEKYNLTGREISRIGAKASMAAYQGDDDHGKYFLSRATLDKIVRREKCFSILRLN